MYSVQPLASSNTRSGEASAFSASSSNASVMSLSPFMCHRTRARGKTTSILHTHDDTLALSSHRTVRERRSGALDAEVIREDDHLAGLEPSPRSRNGSISRQRRVHGLQRVRIELVDVTNGCIRRDRFDRLESDVDTFELYRSAAGLTGCHVHCYQMYYFNLIVPAGGPVIGVSGERVGRLAARPPSHM